MVHQLSDRRTLPSLEQRQVEEVDIESWKLTLETVVDKQSQDKVHLIAALEFLIILHDFPLEMEFVQLSRKCRCSNFTSSQHGREILEVCRKEMYYNSTTSALSPLRKIELYDPKPLW